MPEAQREHASILPADRMRWLIDRELRQSLRQTFRNATGVHIHGVWETHCMVASGMARECKRPYVISVHGMLEKWALRNKRLKKALYAALIEIRRMQRATCLRALSLDEVNDYRRLGLTNPIAVIPNGIDTPPTVSPEFFKAQHPELANKRIVLFFGRLHQKKGLDLLLQAFAKIAPSQDDLHLVIAGPDSDGSRTGLESLTSDLHLQSRVNFTGMLTGNEKWSLLNAADLFVLPSYSEGFSIAVLEALALGVPVLVTPECHIPDVLSHRCGWIAAPAVDPLVNALREFSETKRPELAVMGERGRNLVNERFHSSVVGAKIAQLYDWLQGGKKPTSFEIV